MDTGKKDKNVQPSAICRIFICCIIRLGVLIFAYIFAQQMQRVVFSRSLFQSVKYLQCRFRGKIDIARTGYIIPAVYRQPPIRLIPLLQHHNMAIMEPL